MKKFILSLIVLLGSVLSVSAQVKFTCNPQAEISRAGSVGIYISISNNTTSFDLYSFQVTLPKGTTISADKIQYEKCLQNYNHTVTNKDNGDIQILGTTKGGEEVPNSKLLTFNIEANNEIADGEYDCSIVCNLTKDGYQSYAKSTLKFKLIVNGTKKNTLILNSTTNTLQAGTYNCIEVQRSFKKDNWATLMLPITISAKKLKEITQGSTLATFKSFAVSKMNGYNVKSVALNMVELPEDSEIPANEPFLIKPATDFNSIVIDNIYLKDFKKVTGGQMTFKEKNNLVNEEAKFIGVYYPTVIPAKDLLIANNTLYYSRGANKINCSKAYIHLPVFAMDEAKTEGNQAKEFSLTLVDETTGISEVVNDGINELLGKTTPVYNLSGQRVGTTADNLPAGIYISNGKKFIVK